jgi:hypothetical protein
MASHFFKRGALILVALGLCFSSACVSSKYRQADKRIPPAKALNVKFPPAILDASLCTEISDGAPGSWKRETYWDEYVVTIHNPGDQPLEITSTTLTDYAEAPHRAGDNPWALERESKTLEKRYQDDGIAFARAAAPRVIVSAAEPGVVASAGVGSAGAAAAATITAVALPIYGATVLGINIHNKKAMTKEFNRRRLPLPLALGAGETRTGSFFFPTIPNPHALTLHWSSSSGEGDTALGLDFLEGLHVKE